MAEIKNIEFDNPIEISDGLPIPDNEKDKGFPPGFTPGFVEIEKNLAKPVFDISNIKKIYDIFPRSLKTNRIISERLLELLRSQLDTRNKTIEQLQADIERILTDEISAGDTISQLTDSLQNIGLDNLIDDLLGTFADQEKNTLISQGFIQLGADSDVLVRVKTTESELNDRKDEFYISHRFGQTFSNADVLSPTFVEIKNVGSQDAFIKKREKWFGTFDDGATNQTLQLRYKNDINVFNFNELGNITGENSVKINANSSLTTPIGINYSTPGSYEAEGFIVINDITDYLGELLLASSRSKEILERETDEQQGLSNFTSIGSMRLRLND